MLLKEHSHCCAIFARLVHGAREVHVYRALTGARVGPAERSPMSDQRERTMIQMNRIGAVTTSVRWAVPLAIAAMMCMPASGWAKDRRELPTPPGAAQSP